MLEPETAVFDQEVLFCIALFVVDVFAASSASDGNSAQKLVREKPACGARACLNVYRAAERTRKLDFRVSRVDINPPNGSSYLRKLGDSISAVRSFALPNSTVLVQCDLDDGGDKGNERVTKSLFLLDFFLPSHIIQWPVGAMMHYDFSRITSRIVCFICLPFGPRLERREGLLFP